MYVYISNNKHTFFITLGTLKGRSTTIKVRFSFFRTKAIILWFIWGFGYFFIIFFISIIVWIGVFTIFIIRGWRFSFCNFFIFVVIIIIVIRIGIRVIIAIARSLFTFFFILWCITFIWIIFITIVIIRVITIRIITLFRLFYRSSIIRWWFVFRIIIIIIVIIVIIAICNDSLRIRSST